MGLRMSRIGVESVLPFTYTLKTLPEAQAAAQNIIQALHLQPRVYIGLLELLINAIEHGNLEIDYEQKTQLVESKKWQEEIAQRYSQSPYKDRFVKIKVDDSADYYIISIEDQGGGFDWLHYTNALADVTDNRHGRGILIAQMISFQRLEYLGTGNKLKCYIEKSKN